MYRITRTDQHNPDFRKLVTMLDRELKELDGEEHAFYAQFNGIDLLNNAVVCYHNEEVVGCGAFKKHNEGKAEIKRMFVVQMYRSKGIGYIILKELETWAKETGFDTCILETGKKQPDAIRLYRKAGYETISNFPPYEEDQNSVCMSKLI